MIADSVESSMLCYFKLSAKHCRLFALFTVFPLRAVGLFLYFGYIILCNQKSVTSVPQCLPRRHVSQHKDHPEEPRFIGMVFSTSFLHLKATWHCNTLSIDDNNILSTRVGEFVKYTPPLRLLCAAALIPCMTLLLVLRYAEVL